MAEDDIILQELRASVRQDQLKALWKRFGPLIIAGVLALIVAVAANAAWKHFAQAENEKTTAALLAAQAKDDNALSIAESFGAITEGNKYLRAIAAIHQAQQLIKAGKKDDAYYVLKQLLASGFDRNDPLYDYALLLMASIPDAIAQNNDHRAALLAQAGRPGAPFAATAREMQAADLLAAGKKEEASALLQALAEDKDAPESLRGRAKELLPPAKPQKSSPEEVPADASTQTDSPVKNETGESGQ